MKNEIGVVGIDGCIGLAAFVRAPVTDDGAADEKEKRETWHQNAILAPTPPASGESMG